MKRLFWSFLLAIGAAIGVWFISRRRMDALHGEISRLREVERKFDAMREQERIRNENFRKDSEEMKRERASRTPLTTEQNLKKAMLEAVFDAEAREKLGENYIENIDNEEDES